jgi:hypothetical protein
MNINIDLWHIALFFNFTAMISIGILTILVFNWIFFGIFMFFLILNSLYVIMEVTERKEREKNTEINDKSN